MHELRNILSLCRERMSIVDIQEIHVTTDDYEPFSEPGEREEYRKKVAFAFEKGMYIPLNTGDVERLQSYLYVVVDDRNAQSLIKQIYVAAICLQSLIVFGSAMPELLDRTLEGLLNVTTKTDDADLTLQILLFLYSLRQSGGEWTKIPLDLAVGTAVSALSRMELQALVHSATEQHEFTFTHQHLAKEWVTYMRSDLASAQKLADLVILPHSELRA